jgi:integrative and conjugative element protein (TIGR02256 family)
VHPSHPLTVWLASGLLRDLADEAEWRLPDEAGGVLVGYRNAGAIVVTGSVHAGPRAERWPSGLRPDREVQNAELDRIFVESDGATTFVGEWHSHPLARAIPSKRDRKTLRNTLRDPASATDVSLMVILERSDDDETWSAVGWAGQLGRLGRLGPLAVRAARLRVFRDPERRP